MTRPCPSCIAVEQTVEHQPWDTGTVIPKDDSAIFTTLLPLTAVLVVYGVVLFFSLHGGGEISEQVRLVSEAGRGSLPVPSSTSRASCR
jgi:hypothetical protein